MAAKSTNRSSHEYDQYANKMSLLRNEFDRRFKDISKIEDHIIHVIPIQ